jgi:transposase
MLTQGGRQWLRSKAWPLLSDERRLFICMQWDLIDQITPMIRTLDRRIEHVGQQVPAVALLRTVPGIGPYRALLIATETLPIQRFRTPAHLVSYAGLAPRSSQSGLRPIRHGSIPAGANRWLRGAFVRAVVSHTAHAPDSWLSQSYDQLKQRLGWQVARVATARRLARATHAMLRTGEAWRDVPMTRQD